MCGRFTISVSSSELKEYLTKAYDIHDFKEDFNIPRYNVSPGQDVIAIINDGLSNRAGFIKWGFVPSFAKDEKIGFSMINAKSETLKDKPSFLPSLKNKRCIILADSFYEWKRTGSSKTPLRISLKDKKVFPMAGLWSSYTRSDGTKLYTCTIVTTSANEAMSKVHERMPVILSEESKNIWLNSKISDPDTLSKLLLPYESYQMQMTEVSSFVNNSSNESIECIKPVEH